MDQIRALDLTRWPTPTKLSVDQPPATPSGSVATGQQGLIRIQWAAVTNVDGYDVAIMTTPNLANPDVNIARVPGAKNREYVYPMGNSATLRYFAVRSYLSDVYSDWAPIISATSVVFGAAESAPPAAPSSPPSGSEPPPSGDGGPRELSLL